MPQVRPSLRALDPRPSSSALRCAVTGLSTGRAGQGALGAGEGGLSEPARADEGNE